MLMADAVRGGGNVCTKVHHTSNADKMPAGDLNQRRTDRPPLLFSSRFLRKETKKIPAYLLLIEKN